MNIDTFIADCRKMLEKEKMIWIVVGEIGAYTVGGANLGIPDLVFLSKSNFTGETLNSILSIHKDNPEGDIGLLYDKWRINFRNVPLEAPSQHLALQRDLAPNTRLKQIILPDQENRLPGEEGFEDNLSSPAILFEEWAGIFYDDAVQEQFLARQRPAN